MTRDDFNKIFTNIKNEYSNFDGDYDEWYDVLMDYSYQDVVNKLNEKRGTTAPIHTSLIKGLKKEQKIEDWITCCDICGEKMIIHNNDLMAFEKHYRKCQKIDFIDTISKNYKGKPITRSIYYAMDDIELEKNYRQVMNYYLEHRDLTKLFKKMPNGE